jgi:hypothetical protein
MTCSFRVKSSLLLKGHNSITSIVIFFRPPKAFLFEQKMSVLLKTMFALRRMMTDLKS